MTRKGLVAASLLLLSGVFAASARAQQPVASTLPDTPAPHWQGTEKALLPPLPRYAQTSKNPLEALPALPSSRSGHNSIRDFLPGKTKKLYDFYDKNQASYSDFDFALQKRINHTRLSLLVGIPTQNTDKGADQAEKFFLRQMMPLGTPDWSTRSLRQMLVGGNRMYDPINSRSGVAAGIRFTF